MANNKPKKVFVIEDDPDHLEAILFVLEGMVIDDSLLDCGKALIQDTRHLIIDGSEENTSENDDDLVRYLCEHVGKYEPDLITVDQIMPIRGSAIYFKLKDYYKGPFIFTTVAPHDPAVEKVLNDADSNARIISKPFTSRHLKKAVRDMLSGK